ncbi:MAG: hypothetical protein HYY15_05250 [Candidatus Omnitrophica bacterium]|nr:hypothetical protein [Candidatus Omnitrophota bacterium]
MPRIMRDLQPRERRLGLLAAIIIGGWMLLAGVVEPLWHDVRAATSLVEARTEKLQALNRLMEEAPAIEREYRAAAPYVTAEEQGIDAVLSELEALSRNVALPLSLKPRQAPGAAGTGREVELEIEGPQEQVLRFVDGLFGMNRLLVIERVQLSSVPMADRELRASLLVQVLRVP